MVFLVLLCDFSLGIKYLRAQMKQSGPNAVNARPLGSVNAPDKYTGLAFQPGSQNPLSIDVGSTAAQLSNTPAPNQLVVGYDAPDYGMLSPKFDAPAISYTVPINSWSPPGLTLKGCPPSEYSPAACSQAKMANYNLGVRNFISATAMPR